MLQLTFTRREAPQEREACERLARQGWALESRTGRGIITLRFRRTLNER